MHQNCSFGRHREQHQKPGLRGRKRSNKTPRMEDFSADRTRASAGTRFPPPPHGFVHCLTPSASRSTFRHQTASHRIDVFLSVMTRGSGSPLPQSADSVQRPMLVIGGCDPGRIALLPKSSPLYKCMGVEHLCGCQHGLFLHKSYTHIVLLGLGSFGCVHPGGSLVLSSVTRGAPLQTRQTGHGQDDKCATASQGPHVHFPVELLHACLCQDSESRMTFAK